MLNTNILKIIIAIASIFVLSFIAIITKKIKLYNEKSKKKKLEQQRNLIRKTYTEYWEYLPTIYNQKVIDELYYPDLVLVVQRISDNFLSEERHSELLSYSQYPDTGRRHYYRKQKISELQKILGNAKWKYRHDGVKTNYYDYPILPNLDLDYLLHKKLKMPWE